MNTLFRICFNITLAMIIFNLALAFVDSTGAFPAHPSYTPDVTAGNALSKFTTLAPGNQNMDALFKSLLGLGLLGAIAIAALLHSVAPIGVYLFGAVFWAAFIKTSFLFNQGGFFPPEVIVIFTVGMIFLFIGAIAGMLTGSG